MCSRVTVVGLCVCVHVSVCLSVTTLTTTMFVHGHQIRYHRLFYQFMDFAEKALFKRHGVICLPWRALTLSAPRNTPAVLDNTRTDRLERYR